MHGTCTRVMGGKMTMTTKMHREMRETATLIFLINESDYAIRVTEE